MAVETDLRIRDCETLDDFRQCVEVQQAVWGFEDRDLIPLRFFVVARKIEGQVFGAFEPSGRLVAFCLAVPALRGSTLYLHSHMLAVLPEHRGRGLGRRMKLAQRTKALVQGIRLIEWTFDPLEAGNAWFNLERLGAIARRYVPNHYGSSTSPLHRNLPTDRLVAEWWLDSPAAAARAMDQPAPPREISRRITLPLDIAEKSDIPDTSLLELQAALRRQFQDAFSQGLAAVGFELSKTTGNYLLGSWAGAE